uniref:GTA baseplate fiber-binding domain-containing protein n=1 Tax=Rhizobium halophilum TaxID=2846852 RepID=UPI00293F754E|nr:hypothetical protein [Rhizobium halophilum]
MLQRPARIGRLTAPLPSGKVSGRFDRSATIDLDLFFGGISSAAPEAVLAGENRLAVRSVGGSWEIIHFVQAEEVAPGRWELSRLLRGLAGTEDAMALGAAVAAPIVLLDEAVVPLGLSVEERGRSLNWIAEGAGAPAGAAGPFAFAGGIRAQTPLSPVHISGARFDDGIRLSWVRRGRLDADDWAAADIPLDEPEERYRVEILHGMDVRRAVNVPAPAFLYAAADEIADFGELQSLLAVRVRQMGRAVPLGLPAHAVISV